MCFASNQTLGRPGTCQRAHDRASRCYPGRGRADCARYHDERQTRARRDGQGRVVVASGLSLAPLFDRYAELAQLAQDHAETPSKGCNPAQPLQAASGPASAALTACCNALGIILRRRADEETLTALHKELTVNLRDSDTQFEGHKETQSIPSVKDDDLEENFPRFAPR
ncbi:helix-turn-helix domain-containing protein [Leisingera sp. M658]|uniref:helix-turn-helix domain-containing protein n=1 Tax=Leisingera sp. M658 TaxID=2867015 RepID=UPI0021A6C56A|nr:helix-turn-helix domain-containing protein [Leisingera sp. M658]UWQ77399.1 hypothetical protein K3724_22640 [Leisingera sp. M658]